MILTSNRCHRCLNFMEVRKVEEEYHLICPHCEEEDKKQKAEF